MLLEALVGVKVKFLRHGQFLVGRGHRRGRLDRRAETRGRFGLPGGDLRAQRHVLFDRGLCCKPMGQMAENIAGV